MSASKGAKYVVDRRERETWFRLQVDKEAKVAGVHVGIADEAAEVLQRSDGSSSAGIQAALSSKRLCRLRPGVGGARNKRRTRGADRNHVSAATAPYPVETLTDKERTSLRFHNAAFRGSDAELLEHF